MSRLVDQIREAVAVFADLKTPPRAMSCAPPAMSFPRRCRGWRPPACPAAGPGLWLRAPQRGCRQLPARAHGGVGWFAARFHPRGARAGPDSRRLVHPEAGTEQAGVFEQEWRQGSFRRRRWHGGVVRARVAAGWGWEWEPRAAETGQGIEDDGHQSRALLTPSPLCYRYSSEPCTQRNDWMSIMSRGRRSWRSWRTTSANASRLL